MYRLGLIAGEGQFPLIVLNQARLSGSKIFVAAMRGHTQPDLPAEADGHVWVRLGQLGKLIRFFVKNKVDKVVFAGPVNKPKALEVRPDFRAAKLLFRIKTRGDDSILRAIAAEFEREGMQVVSALSVVPDLATMKGVLSLRSPDEREKADIQFGWKTAKELGRLDIGQCVVVKERMVVALEAMEGTDATILRAGEMAGPGCVVVKVFKPGQDDRIDMPAIGLGTLQAMQKAGAKCLAVEAGKSLFFDPEKSVGFADERGISLVGM